MDFEFNNFIIIRVLNLPSKNPPSLEYVFFATNSISINFIRKKTTMPIIEKVSKTVKKAKVVLANTTILSCLSQKNTCDKKSKPSRKKYCSSYRSFTYHIVKY